MPANIQTYIGRESAWHKLGTVTGKHQTWADILAHGGLDFDVFKSQLRDGLGRTIDAWGVFRWDKADKLAHRKDAAQFLGTVGKDYRIINHASGFELIDVLMQTADGAHYETAGVLGKGETVWGLADLGLRLHVGGDETVPYLLFATSHDGSMSYQLRICATRVVCENTLSIALSESRAQFKVRHTKSAGDRIADARQALEAYGRDCRTMEEKLNWLASRMVTRETFTNIMDRLFPIKTKAKDSADSADSADSGNTTRRGNMLAEILSIYEANDNGAFPEQRESAYCLLNAITNYTDHERVSRGNGRAESALFGSGDKLKTSALELILETSKDMPANLRWRAPGAQQSVAVDWADLGLNIRN